MTLEVLKVLLGEEEPRSCYLFPEIPGQGLRYNATPNDEIFVFQYWPETLDSTYTVNYAQKSPMGGTHDLQQWTGGSGRDITFSTAFTAEMNTGGRDGANSGIVSLLPSARYTVDVRGAVSMLQSFMLPSYGRGGLNDLAHPPKKLYLVLEGTGLGGDRDAVLCLLKSAPITYEAWFQNGTPRIVALALTFSEIVQRTTTNPEKAAIRFAGRESFERDGAHYKYRGATDRTMG